MLKYLIVLIDDSSVSFCHYQTWKGPRLMDEETLEACIKFAMKENLVIQYVLPNSGVPEHYLTIMDKSDNIKIAPAGSTYTNIDVIVADLSEQVPHEVLSFPGALVIRGTFKEFLAQTLLIEAAIQRKERTNVVLTDVATMSDTELDKYRDTLLTLAAKAADGQFVPQYNILTDRIFLQAMNNCGAGSETITAAPSGELFICPGFYYDNNDSIGNVKGKYEIGNRCLYQLKYAPICRECDAFQCKRCVWLNKKTTLEVNTPGRQQCVAAHHERNAARAFRRLATGKFDDINHLPDIPEIDYVDPFEKIRKINNI